MLKALLQHIPRMLYEPMAVSAILALAVMAVFYWKKRNSFTVFLAFAISFMLLWRILSGIISDRYAAVLIVPAVISSAWLFFNLARFLEYKHWLPVKFCRILPYLLLAGMVIACVAKTMRFNTYQPLYYGQLAVKDDLARRKVSKAGPVLVVEPASRKMTWNYYTGIKTGGLNRQKAGVVKLAATKYRPVYLVLKEETSAEPLRPEFFGLKKPWEKIYECYYNFREREVMRIYRID